MRWAPVSYSTSDQVHAVSKSTVCAPGVTELSSSSAGIVHLSPPLGYPGRRNIVLLSWVSHCGLGVILEGPSLGSGCHPQGSHHSLHPSPPSSLGRSLICLWVTCLSWEGGEKEKVKIPGETQTGQLHQHGFLGCRLCPKRCSRSKAAAIKADTALGVSQGELEGAGGDGHNGYHLWSSTLCRVLCPFIHILQQHNDMPLLPPFYRRGNRGRERFSDLPKLVDNRVGFGPRESEN